MIKTTQYEDGKRLSLMQFKQSAMRLFDFLKIIFKNPIVCKSLYFGIMTTVFLLIFQKLSLIGWENIYMACPSSPLFYMLAIALFLIPITADIISCRLIIGCKVPDFVRVFTRKHAYNEAIFSYMGEAYLIKVIGKLPNFDLRRAAITIKDQSLIRTFVSNAWLIVLVVLAVLMGQSDALMGYTSTSPKNVGGAALLCVGLCALMIIFFRKLTRLSMRTAIGIAGVYGLKAIMILAVQISQWNIAMPGTEVSIWLLFAVFFALSKKSPFSGELVFVSVILTIPGLGVNEANVAAMLIMATAINQFILLTMFILTSNFTGLSWLKNRAHSPQTHRKPYNIKSNKTMTGSLKQIELSLN